MKTVVRIVNKICKGSGIVSGFLFFSLATIITIDVLARWIFGQPFVGVFEISQVTFLACTFLVIGLVQKMERHISVDILISRVRGKPRHLMDAVVALSGLIFFVVLLWVGCKEWLEAWRGHYVRRGLIDLPNTIHLGFLIFGSFLICMNLLHTTIVKIQLIFSHYKTADLSV